MKKKGLIISTIVMVVVLIASLTTATYAWFSTSAVTSLSSFDVSVQTSNLFKIGLSKTGTYNGTVAESQFVTGATGISTKAATPGSLVCNGWTGSINGLSSALMTDIHWGPQSKAVGFADSQVSDATLLAGGNADTLGIGSLGADSAYVYAANGADASASAALEKGITKAYANEGAAADGNADYVYLFLGVAPNAALTADTAEIIIMVDGNTNTNSTLVGILAAIHVAYKVNAQESWTDVDVFGDIHWSDYKSGTDAISTVGTPRSGSGERTALSTTSGDNNDEQDTFRATYSASGEDTAISTGAAFVRIPLTQTAVGSTNIDQVQILIYIDGTDSDCIREATNNAGGTVRIFFHGLKAA